MSINPNMHGYWADNPSSDIDSFASYAQSQIFTTRMESVVTPRPTPDKRLRGNRKTNLFQLFRTTTWSQNKPTRRTLLL